MLYRVLIIIATLIWGSSFVVVKDTTDAISPAWILVVRFFMGAAILALVFLKKRELYFKREYVCFGALFGAALFCAYYFQTVGITDTTPGKNAFLTAVYCVLVPFIAWALAHKRPNRFNVVAALLALVGMGHVCLDSGLSLGFGDGMTLVCAVFYALHIVLVAKFSQGRDIFVLTMWQFFFVGVIALVVGGLFEPMPDWTSVDGGTWAALAYLGVACTAVALLFQNIAQKHLAPSSAALLLSLESPFGVAFSVALGAEVLTTRILVGFAVIFVAILVSELLPTLRRKREPQEA